MRKTARVAAVGAIAALTLAGCGERSTDNETTGSDIAIGEFERAVGAVPDFKACMVSDSGGFDDKSFNQTSHDGLVAAEENLGVQTGEVESNAPSEFADNIHAMVDEDCNSITTVGFLLGDATLAAAKKNKDVDFSIVDFAYEKAPPTSRA